MPFSDNVVTVFCCGTKAHRETQGEAVADMFRWCDSERKWINDGPGSMGHAIPQVEHLFQEGKQPGLLHSALRTGPYAVGHELNLIPNMLIQAATPSALVLPLAGSIAVAGSALASVWTSISTVFAGAIGGRGTNNNVLLTLQWLWLEYYKKPFTVCNLTGWSRGGVTAIAIANVMDQAGFGSRLGVCVNIFAYDPVPGDFNDFGKSGDFGSSGRAGIENLSSIVNTYHSILMENVGDEMAALFKIIDPSETRHSTKKKTYPLMGAHGDCVKWTKEPGYAGKIGLSLGLKFLQDHGTPFLTEASSHILDDTQLIEEYSDLRRLWLKKNNWKPENVGPDMWRYGTVVNQRRDSIYFVNEHHFELFNKLLLGYVSSATSTKVIGSETHAALKQRFPRTIRVLQETKCLRDPAVTDPEAIFEIEVLPAPFEISIIRANLENALIGSRAYPRVANSHKLWTLEEWKHASSVIMGSRRDQVLVIDRLLPVYHEAGPKNRVSQFWLLFPIAKQITSHLKEKGIRSDRHLAMAQLGRQVRNVLRGDIPQRWNG